MVTVLNHSPEKMYGPNDKDVAGLLNRLLSIDWFSKCGKQSGEAQIEKALREFTYCLGIEGYEIKWIITEQLPAFLDGMRLEESQLWPQIQSIPSKIKKKAKEVGRLSALSTLTDVVPEILFHSSFDGAFHQFGKYGASVVKTAVGVIMYVFGLACAWEVLADIEGWENNPFMPLVEVFEQGHWTLGLFDNQFYVI